MYLRLHVKKNNAKMILSTGQHIWKNRIIKQTFKVCDPKHKDSWLILRVNDKGDKSV